MTKPISIFISKSLKDKSPIQKLISDGHNIIAQSLIDIKPIEIQDYPATDWIFFSTANSVKHFFSTQKHSNSYQYGVIDTGAATVFYSITGMSPKYTGNGIPGDVAENFITYEKGKSILIVKAKNSKNTIHVLLSEYMTCSDLIVYENKIKKEFDIPPCSHLIFTNPISVEAYFTKYDYNMEDLYAIDGPTAACIKRLTGYNASVPEITSDYGLYRIVKKELEM